MDLFDEELNGVVLITESRLNIDSIVGGLKIARTMMDRNVDWDIIKQVLPVVATRSVVLFNEAIKHDNIYVIDKEMKRLGECEILFHDPHNLIIFINNVEMIPLTDTMIDSLVQKYLPMKSASMLV